MKARVDAGEFASPYLFDETQEVARAWGAKKTPDVFVTDASGVVYRGAPDADHGDPSLNAAWLREALDDVLAGRPVARRRDAAGRLLDQMALIELLYWEGCPSHPAALAMLRAILGDDAEIALVEIVDEADAERERFVGSPTIRVDGVDLFPVEEPPSLTCRIYRLADGRFSPTPDPGELRARLGAASARSGRRTTSSAPSAAARAAARRDVRSSGGPVGARSRRRDHRPLPVPQRPVRRGELPAAHVHIDRAANTSVAPQRCDELYARARGASAASSSGVVTCPAGPRAAVAAASRAPTRSSPTL